MTNTMRRVLRYKSAVLARRSKREFQEKYVAHLLKKEMQK
jgi:hypothetical protein